MSPSLFLISCQDFGGNLKLYFITCILFVDGLDIKDYGDIDTTATDAEVKVDNMAHLPQVSACNKKLSERVSQVLKDGRVAVTIGGDHSIGVGEFQYLLNV